MLPVDSLERVAFVRSPIDSFANCIRVPFTKSYPITAHGYDFESAPDFVFKRFELFFCPALPFLRMRQ